MERGGNPAPQLTARLAMWLDGLLGLVAAVLLFLMMCLTFVDVVGRYVFSRPVPGAFELTEVAMAVLIFAGLPLISARDGHIAVNILDGLIPARVLRLRAVVMDVLIAGCCGVLGWILWKKAGQFAAFGDSTAFLRLPIAPVVYLMATLGLLTCLGMAAKAMRGAVALWRGAP